MSPDAIRHMAERALRKAGVLYESNGLASAQLACHKWVKIYRDAGNIQQTAYWRCVLHHLNKIWCETRSVSHTLSEKRALRAARQAAPD